MTRVVVALYDEFSDVETAIKELLENSYSRQDISLLANDVGGRFGQFSAGVNPQPDGGEVRTGAGVGALTGGMGGVLVGYRALELPGIGPVVVAGPLAEAFQEGGAPGDEQPVSQVLEALTGMGVPEELAHTYAEGVRRGATLVAQYTADHMADDVRTIMNRHNPVDLTQRVNAWRDEGWAGFEPGLDPLTLEELHVERQRAQLLAYGDEFLAHEDRFRHHFHDHYAGSSYGYDDYLPAYHLGFLAAGQPDQDWEAVEPRLREAWEQEHAGQWEEFQEAARYAWESTRAAQE